MNHKGFTLVETLIAFSCVMLSILMVAPLISSVSKMWKQNYQSEDRIAIYQLRILLAQSKDVRLQNQQLSFIYRKQETILEWHKDRLVKRDGYIIYLQDIDDGFFIQEDGCIYAQWTRNKNTKQALLSCE